jgi:hypothetical protein
MANRNVVKMNLQPSKLEEAFDFSSLEPTVEEIMRIRQAAERGLLTIPSHATFAAVDDSITIPQILGVILNGIAISKDSPSNKSRIAGINFEGRSGGKRKLRAKVSWSEGYYVVTVHLVKTITRRSRSK